MMQKLTDSLTGIAMGGIGTPVLQRYPSLTPLLLFLGFQAVQAANPVGEKRKKSHIPFTFAMELISRLPTAWNLPFPSILLMTAASRQFYKQLNL